jgi:L-aminopeptidase/D-esterase-like protein
VAAVAHDGLARAIRPVHSMTDGDTIFCLASGNVPAASDPLAVIRETNLLLVGAADVVAGACLDAVVSATGRGQWRSYSELAPSTVVG